MVKLSSSIKLSTGADLPLLGYGTWLSMDPTLLEAALSAALDIGYRLIDTAYVYGNEAVIGNVLKKYFTSGKLKREDIFITTKLPFTAHSPDDIPKVIDVQLKNLQVDYIDLYLIHTPCPVKHGKDDNPSDLQALTENGLFVAETINHIDTWRVLENFFEKGILKAIGLSNFNQEQIQNILDHSKIKPHNLQVEAHVYFPQNELFEFCKKNNITMTAYATLGSPGRKEFRPNRVWPSGSPIDDPAVCDLAKKHKKTPAQILIRQMMQREIAVIPKSTNITRVQENFDVLDFQLDDDDMKLLSSIKKRIRLFIFDQFKNHPFYFIKDATTRI